MIRQRNGIEIDLGERKIHADPGKGSGKHRLVSHAHFDHMSISDSSGVICSDATADLASARTGEKVEPVDDRAVELLPAGHIAGSRAAVVEAGETVLYTGDFSPRERLYMDGFSPVEADVLVMETTYGVPPYRFPPQSELEGMVEDWIQDSSGPLYLFGYSLGKAQKIQKMVEKLTDRPIIAHGAVKRMNEAVEEATGIEFRAEPYVDSRDLLRSGEGIFVGPPRFSKEDSLEKLVQKSDGVKAGFSGWAVNDSFRFRGSFDRGFPLSDHADFEELVETVEKVDPEKVYTVHGFDDEFASHLKRELGYNARALKNNQSSLVDF